MQFATLFSALTMLCIVVCNPLPAHHDPTALDDMVANTTTSTTDMIANITTKDMEAAIITKDIGPPQNVGLYMCSEPDWNGTCHWAIPEGILDANSDTICHDLPYSNSIFISFGPDTGIICKVWVGRYCEKWGDLIEYPGWPSLPRTQHPLFGVFNSYQCHLKA